MDRIRSKCLMDSNVECLGVCVHFWPVKFDARAMIKEKSLVFLWLGSFFWVQPKPFQSVSLNPIILTRSPIIMYKFTLSIVWLRPKSKLDHTFVYAGPRLTATDFLLGLIQNLQTRSCGLQVHHPSVLHCSKFRQLSNN